jgi:hypothetical protein
VSGANDKQQCGQRGKRVLHRTSQTDSDLSQRFLVAFRFVDPRAFGFAARLPCASAGCVGVRRRALSLVSKSSGMKDMITLIGRHAERLGRQVGATIPGSGRLPGGSSTS